MILAKSHLSTLFLSRIITQLYPCPFIIYKLGHVSIQVHYKVTYIFWDHVFFIVSHSLTTGKISRLFPPIMCNCFQLNFHKLGCRCQPLKWGGWWMFRRSWGNTLFLVVNLRETWKKIRNRYMRIGYPGCFPQKLWTFRVNYGCWGAGLGASEE